MNEKHREVEQWLDSLYGGELHPSYEVNATTIDLLWQLKQTNERQDQATNLVIEDWRQKTAEYAMEGARIGNILSHVGLSPSSLSQSGTVSLRTLVNTTIMLNTKDASKTNLMLAISDSSQAASRVTEARKQEAKLHSQLLNKNKSALLKYTTLTKALAGLDKEVKCQGPELEKKAQQAAFLQSKGKEYRKHLQQLQEDLKTTGVDPSVYHDTLTRRAEFLQDLREKLHPIRAKLDSYQKLPPDLALARVKVEEMRRELEALEEQLNSQIDMMHM